MKQRSTEILYIFIDIMPFMKISYWVYILHCENGNYYTGYTTDLARRFDEHVQGTGKCKYTRSFKPLSIAQSWKIESSKSTAMKIERFIKKLTKEEKRKLILSPGRLAEMFSF